MIEKSTNIATGLDSSAARERMPGIGKGTGGELRAISQLKVQDIERPVQRLASLALVASKNDVNAADETAEAKTIDQMTDMDLMRLEELHAVVHRYIDYANNTQEPQKDMLKALTISANIQSVRSGEKTVKVSLLQTATGEWGARVEALKSKRMESGEAVKDKHSFSRARKLPPESREKREREAGQFIESVTNLPKEVLAQAKIGPDNPDVMQRLELWAKTVLAEAASKNVNVQVEDVNAWLRAKGIPLAYNKREEKMQTHRAREQSKRLWNENAEMAYFLQNRLKERIQGMKKNRQESRKNLLLWNAAEEEGKYIRQMEQLENKIDAIIRDGKNPETVHIALTYIRQELTSSKPDYASTKSMIDAVDTVLATAEIGVQGIDMAAGTLANFVPYGSVVYNVSKYGTMAMTGQCSWQDAATSVALDVLLSYAGGKIGSKVLKLQAAEQIASKILPVMQRLATSGATKELLEENVKDVLQEVVSIVCSESTKSMIDMVASADSNAPAAEAT